ncbi:hypothetical protein FB451DRAFT_1563344 [Mycena latifolia]|nr:hypothetical protein FB451DRAFT_1563344 [Mycena latifolia]
MVPTLPQHLLDDYKPDRDQTFGFLPLRERDVWVEPGHLHTLAEDPRFVMMLLEHYTQDWQRGILTGNDYWSRADSFIGDEDIRGNRSSYLLFRGES